MRGTPLQDRFRGALLGTAVGDALGAPFEGAGRPRPRDLAVVERDAGLLRWTDDTAMTLAVAESLAEHGGFDGAAMAHRFAEEHRREPWRGYGAGPPQIFTAIRAGAPWEEPARALFGGSGSFGNGGAMRAAPAGLLSYGALPAAAQLARQQAAITHTHEQGLQGAALQACAVAWLVCAQPTEGSDSQPGLLDEIRGYAPAPEFGERLTAIADLRPDAAPASVVAALGNGVAAVESVPAALWAFVRHPRSFVDTVRAAITLGGDTDTIAALAGALSGAFLGCDAIPRSWQERLEARERLVAAADRLLAVASQPSSATVTN